MTELGLIVQVMFAVVDVGAQVRLTLSVKPAADSRTIFDVACCPGDETVAE